MLGYGGSTHCRREQLLLTFDLGAPERSAATHTCCDTCAAKRKYGGSECDEENRGRGFAKVELFKVKAVSNSTKNRLKVREVPEEASDAFRQELTIYRSGLLNAAGKTEGLYMGDDVACGFPLDLINDLVMDASVIKDIDHLVRSYHFFNSHHAEHVLKLFTEIILIGATHAYGLAAVAGLAAMKLSDEEEEVGPSEMSTYIIQTSGKRNRCFYNSLSVLFTGSELRATFMNLAIGAAGYVYRYIIIRQVGQ